MFDGALDKPYNNNTPMHRAREPKTTSSSRRHMKGERRVTVSGETWHYRIGQQHAVLISPGGYKSVVLLSVLTGRSQDTLDRGRRKQTSDGMVMPEHVRDYIRDRGDELRFGAYKRGMPVLFWWGGKRLTGTFLRREGGYYYVRKGPGRHDIVELYHGEFELARAPHAKAS
jgi:hypothetical protein